MARGKSLIEQARELGIDVPDGVSRQRIWQLIQDAKAGIAKRQYTKGGKPGEAYNWEQTSKRRRKGTNRSVAQTFW